MWHDKKMKYLSRGPELVHNTLIHKQYGIQVHRINRDYLITTQLNFYIFQALDGGRLLWGHFEMMRTTLNKKIDLKTMFALYRVLPLWQPIYKKGSPSQNKIGCVCNLQVFMNF